jgi:tRNA(Ile)-lysidine synthase TilS/MesJ
LLSVEKKQIYHYLTQNKISYAVDKTNYLPLYKRNIIRQKINSLSVIEKKNMQKEINQKNQELHQIKKVLKKQIREIITNSCLNLAG